MQKIAAYILLILIGAIIGLSMGLYVSQNQTQNVKEDVKVFIQRLVYTPSENSVLKINLLNNVPEKNLEGKVIVYQDEKQWTSEVTWYYTGLGTAEVICDSINETQNFRLTYTENSPRETYLDRTIRWDEVSVDRTFNFMETRELQITNMQFSGTSGDAGNTIVLSVTNPGTGKITLQSVKVNDGDATWTGTSDYAAGADGTITITIPNWESGFKYRVALVASDGTLVGAFEKTA